MSLSFDPNEVPTPAYVLDLRLLEDNLRILSGVQSAAGCRILLALKAFALWKAFPMVGRYLAGASASSLSEARLASEYLGGELHVCAPAYPPEDFPEILALADHVVFNSLRQWERFRSSVAASDTRVSRGLRINPEHSEVQTYLYDPCATHSRLGIRVLDMPERLPEGIDGLHFHTLCESGVEELARTVGAVEQRFAPWLNQIRWINWGGGHHITKPGYDIDRLVELIHCFRKRYGAEVYLEPGEAVALDAGYLVASVLDIVPGEPEIAILDTSATAHMPDVLEMPYRPTVEGAGLPGEFGHPYRLGGLTCLAGDVMGEYSFEKPLHIGDRLVFHDMAHYTMVKNTAFNGIRQPSIVLVSEESRILRQFSYADYRDRLS